MRHTASQHGAIQ